MDKKSDDFKEDESVLGEYSPKIIDAIIAENPKHYAELAKL